MYYTTPCIKVQRVAMAAFGVRVDGTSSRGLWPPDGGRLCSLRSGGDSAYGAEGCGGGFAADFKKGTRLAPQVMSKSYIRFRGLAPAAPFARYFRYCESAAKEMVSKKFLLDKVKGPAL